MHVGVVAAGQTAVAGDEQDRGTARVLLLAWSAGAWCSSRSPTAVTARVSSVAYGVEAATLRCALTMREAAIISIARVIFLVA